MIKRLISTRFNTKVEPREFEVADLVLRRANVGQKNVVQGKLAPNWEGSYRVASKTGTGAYQLETLRKELVPRTWNADKLRKYFR